MLGRIRLGAYDRIAAQSLGVTPETFCRWMKRGRTERTGIYAQFFQDVSQAKAQARVEAEMKVFRDNPEFWLRCGPGRTERTVVYHPDGSVEEISLEGWTEDRTPPRPQPPAKPSEPLVTPEILAQALAILLKMGVVQPTPTGPPVLTVCDLPDENADP